MASLDAIAQLADQKAKAEQYKASLDAAIAASSVPDLSAFLDHVLSDAVPLVLSRQLLSAFVQSLAQLAPEPQQQVATYALERTQPRAVSYEEQVALLRERLCELFEAQEEWTKAAQALAGIDLDSGMRVLDAEYKLAKYVKISMLYLEDDDPVSAETYIKKASSLLAACKNDELTLQYKSCYARILNSKRRFLEAAQRYYELSQIGKRAIGAKTIDEEDLLAALGAAITCTILAAAGPQRSRMLSTLYKDERSAGLPVGPFLEKVYLGRILRKEEVDSFSQTLAPHQLATLADGSTVLARSVSEHNLEAASKLYANVTFDQLGELLGVAPEAAEGIASRMAMEGRLQASIDQVDGLITFRTSQEPLAQWDRNIQGLCQQVDAVLAAAATKGLPVDAA